MGVQNAWKYAPKKFLNWIKMVKRLSWNRFYALWGVVFARALVIPMPS
jgi:hypothetical protein